MEGSNQNNQNQNSKPNTSTNTNQQKSGLSWTQPTTNVSNSTPNKPVQKAIEAAPTDSTGRVIGIIVGVIVVFALLAWGIVAINKKSATNGSTASSTEETLNGEEASTTSEEGSASGTKPAPVATATKTETPTPTQAPVTKPTPTATPAPVTVAPGSATFTVATQDAGSQVTIANLAVSEPTWVIVYESTNGKPGSILGAGLFFKGDTSGVVHLLRPTVAGQSYLASAAVDNGDKAFTKAAEKYVADASGSQMWIKFQTR